MLGIFFNVFFFSEHFWPGIVLSLQQFTINIQRELHLTLLLNRTILLPCFFFKVDGDLGVYVKKKKYFSLALRS